MSSGGSALLLDLYQLTMAQVYFERGFDQSAVFDLFVRRLRPERRFLVAAGLEQALEYLEGLQFTAAELEYLSGLKLFSARFLDFLAAVRFTGSVHAMAEGTPVFADEPLLRVSAPLIEAQLVESRILNLVHFQTVIASKAARLVLAAAGHGLVDFGMRRAHGEEAALLAARAAFIAGVDATATVEAGRRFGIPVSGTMAHSYIEVHEHEVDAFREFIEVAQADVTLLIDTYDSVRAAGRVVELVRALSGSAAGARIRSVRIDSGDLGAQARAVRGIFDRNGCGQLHIVASGGLDEYQVQELVRSGAPIDAFGIGTNLTVAEDCPALDMAYKLAAYAGTGRRKRSPGKATWPGSKQVYRRCDAAGRIIADRLTLDDEPAQPGSGEQPLLQPVMLEGRRLTASPPLLHVREHCRAQLALLAPELRRLEPGAATIAVQVSPAIEALAERIDART